VVLECWEGELRTQDLPALRGMLIHCLFLVALSSYIV